MSFAELTPLEEVVLERLRRRTGRDDLSELPAEVIQAVRGILADTQLRVEELEALESSTEQAGSDTLGIVLGLRIERALAAGLEVLGAAGGPSGRSEVLVLRAGEDRTDTERQIGRIVQRIRERVAESTRGEGGELVLFAARSVFEKVKRLLPSGAGEGTPSLAFHERAGGADTDSKAPIEVIEADVRFDELERHVRLRIEKIRTESHGEAEGTGAALPLPAPLPAPAVGAAAAPVASEEDDPLIGQLFHLKYRIVRCLGRGGFGAVYEATDERGAGNRVAIKVLSGHAAESAARQQSFKDEARRVTRLSHPNVVDWKVFDETEAGVPYFVMELVKGEDFSETLRREKRIEPMRCARLLLQVVDALRAAHHLSPTESILHLDLKPSNLFLTPGGLGREEQLKVFDFGIGQYIGDDEVEEDGVEEGGIPALEDSELGPSSLTFARPPGRPLTPTSGVKRSLGCTPEYASPEQCAHVLFEDDIVALDGRSDLYSLGVMAFEMLTGERPFQAEVDRFEVLRMHREEPPPTFASKGVRVPRRLARFIARCLEKDPDDRWRDTQHAYEALRAIVHPPVWKAVAKVTIPLVLVGIALGGWFWMTRETRVPIAGLLSENGMDLETGPLYLGPARPSAVLRLAGTRDELPSEPTGVWSVMRVEDGQALEAWSAAWAGSGQVTVSPPGDASGRSEERIELRLDGDRLRSKAFTAAWIGEGTWGVSAVSVGARTADQLFGLDIDPAGLFLDVWVEGVARDLLREVTARVGAGEPLVLPRGTSQGERERYRLDLEDAGLEAGPNELTLVARDEAGSEWTRDLRLDVVHDELDLLRLELVDAGGARCNRSAGRYVLSPRTRPKLLVQLSRAADVSWSVFTGDSRQPALRGASTGRQVFEDELNDIIGLAGGEPFEGVLRFEAREDAYVLRRQGSLRGRIERELPFRYENTEPRFTAQWKQEGRKRDLFAVDDGVLFTNAARAEIVVTRQEAVPMRVEVAWWPEGRPGDASTVVTEDLRNPQTAQTALPVNLSGDGRHRVRVRSFRFDTSADTVAELPDVEETYAIVLDREAPTLALGETSGVPVVTEANALPEAVDVRFGSFSPEDDAAVDLHWELHRLAPDSWEASGDLAGLDPRAPARITVAQPWRDEATDADGSYRLVLSGMDSAGNELHPESMDFEVSLRGPRLLLEAPGGVGKWYREAASGSWTVRMRATDANGVDEVACDLVADQVELPVPLVLEAGSSTSEQVFVGSLLLPYTLSEASVRLRFTARDGHGTRTDWIYSDELQLPVIERPSPERIAVVFDDHEIERMRLIKGNTASPYLFGGRGDEIENGAFVRAGLEPFNRSPRNTRSRSWQIEYAPGRIADFYLDEREVSVAQYLAFLRDPSAALQGPPSAARRDELIAVLASADTERPVTGVTWEEAAAYARWVGKRLPSWVEWEFAVRGGAEEYRPFAAYHDGDPRAAVPIEATFRSAPLACGSSGDWTSDRRFADLCSNVAEWTCTSVGSGEAQRYPHLWAKAHPELLLQHPVDGRASGSGGAHNHYWVVGGSFGGARIDFSVADYRPRDFADPTIGFRCAVALQEVQERLGQAGSPGDPFFEELP